MAKAACADLVDERSAVLACSSAMYPLLLPAATYTRPVHARSTDTSSTLLLPASSLGTKGIADWIAAEPTTTISIAPLPPHRLAKNPPGLDSRQHHINTPLSSIYVHRHFQRSLNLLGVHAARARLRWVGAVWCDEMQRAMSHTPGSTHHCNAQ